MTMNYYIHNEESIYYLNVDSGYNMFCSAGKKSTCDYLNWFGAYYQSGDWWIYHINHGWIYPEADETAGVKLYINDTWVWTCSEIYPYVWRYMDDTWYTF